MDISYMLSESEQKKFLQEGFCLNNSIEDIEKTKKYYEKLINSEDCDEHAKKIHKQRIENIDSIIIIYSTHASTRLAQINPMAMLKLVKAIESKSRSEQYKRKDYHVSVELAIDEILNL